MADSLVYLDASAQPGTHALVIGVGHYRHLAGGEEPTDNPDGMRQLTSPPVSAREFATWLLAEYRNPRLPLASLDVLISDSPAVPFRNPRTGQTVDLPTAEIANIVAAAKAWKARGDSHDDNRLVFYFCGHGVSQGEDMALLAEDVFADRDNPLNGALDLKNLMNGLKRCRASEQLFFVDACRASSDVLIEQSGLFAGQVPLGPGRRPLDFRRRLPVTYYATLPGDRSHARPGEVSLFTKALLKGLRGAGGEDPEGDWWVTTIGLQAALSHLMAEPTFVGPAVGLQVPTVSELPGLIVHELAEPPVVPVYVGCAPAENGQAQFVCRTSGQERGRRDLADVDLTDPDREWALDLPFGDYEFEALLPAGALRRKLTTVRPAYRRVKLLGNP